MHLFGNNKLLILCIFVFILALGVLVANLVAVVSNGGSVAVPDIPREATTVGDGDKLNYLVLGDSTTISQGGDYEKGFVVGTANNLANKHKVTYKNYGVSGARIGDVASSQLDNSEGFTPDIVLIAVGANDVTHLTSLESIEADIKSIVNKLRERNENVVIVFTGSASMGSVSRFIQPLRWLMDQQTKRVNKVFERLSKQYDVTFAYIAQETRQKFEGHPELLAQDKFHPNNDGYAVWTEVLNKVIYEALQRASSV